MKKIYLFIFLIIGIKSSNSWESNIKTDCINEKLEQCLSPELTLKKSSENLNKDLIKPKKAEKEVKKKIKIDKVDKKKIKKKKKIVKIKPKKRVTNKEKLVKKKVTKVSNFKNKNILYENFKKSVINYSETTGYPDIQN